MTICPNCKRVVEDKWHYCVYCAFRLLDEKGTRRVNKPTKHVKDDSSMHKPT